jgi:branched-chain amino acid aminotransferase
MSLDAADTSGWAARENFGTITAMHTFLLHNGELVKTDQRVLSPGQVGFMNGWGVFSTIRVSQGVLFAFHRHYLRMQRDAQRMHVPFPYAEEELLTQLERLVEKNQAMEATLRVALVRNRGGLFEGTGIETDCDLIAFTANIAAWVDGVKLSYQPNGRFGACPFAGAKITSWAQNLVWNEQVRQRGFDEVILLNERGEVSECTSANIFVISGENVYTPPLATSGCLPGVTRQLLLEEICVPGMSITERVLEPADLEKADQVFITSTTRDLLGVASVDGSKLNQHPVSLHLLRNAFLAYQGQYIAAHMHRKEVMLA